MGFLANTNFISDKAFKALNVSRDFDQTKALDKVNFEANWGMTIGLFGHNGAGKSTLLKVFAGISAPSSGSVEIAGIDLRKSRSRSNKIIGYVGHQSMLFQNLTILENLRFFAKMYAISNAADQIHNLLKQFEILEFGEQRVSTLSNGIQKRATIARSLIHSPSILLLDEPETGLDKNGIEILDQVVNNVRSSGSTVLMSTHDLSRGLSLSTDVLALKNGKVLVYSPSQEITNTELRKVLF